MRTWTSLKQKYDMKYTTKIIRMQYHIQKFLWKLFTTNYHYILQVNYFWKCKLILKVLNLI